MIKAFILVYPNEPKIFNIKNPIVYITYKFQKLLNA